MSWRLTLFVYVRKNLIHYNTMEQFNISVENPWLKLVNDENIAECDRNAFPNNLSVAQYAEIIN